MIVYTDQTYQEIVEADSNNMCQLKRVDQLNILYDNMDIPVVEEVMHVYSYPLLEYMGLILIFLMEFQR